MKPGLVAVDSGGAAVPVLVPDATSPLTIEAQHSDGERNLVANDVGHLRDDPLQYFSQIGAWASGSGWRAYTQYIGQRIFYDSFSSEMRGDLLSSPAVAQQIRALARRRLSELPQTFVQDREATLRTLEKQLQDVAKGIAQELVARMDSIRFLRFFGMVVNQGLARMYQSGLNISVDEWSRLRECAKMAQERRQSLIFVPCHRSHVDYICLSFLCFRLGMALPHIVAGENLAMPIVGDTLRKCGAVFIRRAFDGDVLYTTVVQEYISQLLAKGHNLEVFVEGGRSRTGKLLQPKYGILSYIVAALLAGRCSDAFFVPVSLQYDRVIEGSTYVSELLGQPKEKESLAALLGGSSVLNLNLGRIDVRFQKPFSLKGFVDEHRDRRIAEAKTSGQVAPVDFSQNREHRALLLRALGYRILSDINDVAVIMPASLIATVLLTLRGRGVGRQELITRVDWLRSAITKRGGRVSSFYRLSTGDVVDKAIAQMKDLIGEHPNLPEPVYFALNPFELSFYRNSVLHLFLNESLVAVTVYTHVKHGNKPMALTDVHRELQWLSQLLGGEFIFSAQGLEANAKTTIQSMCDDSVLKLEDGHLALTESERATGRERFDTLCFMIWSFCDSYWLAALSLYLLAPTNEDDQLSICYYAEKEFAQRAQRVGQSAYYQGEVTYLEAVNIATLINAWSRYEQLGIIRRRRDKTAKAPVLIALSPEWTPPRTQDGSVDPTGRLFSLLQRLGSHRLEGKSRRETGTLSVSITWLVSTLAKDMPVIEREALVDAHL